MITTLYARFKSWRKNTTSRPSLLLVMPHVCFGGAERWAAAIVQQLHTEGCQIILVILGEKIGEADAAHDWFSPYVKALYYGDAWQTANPAAFLNSLAGKWNASVVMLIGKSSAYPVLPKLRGLRAGLHIVSFQFNAVDLSEEHRQFAPYIDAVIVEGTDVAERLIGHGFSSGKIFHLPSAIRLPDSIQINTEPTRNRGRIGFIGRMDATSKNPITFVEMTDHLQDCDLQFIMIGDGPEIERIEKLLQEKKDQISMELIRNVSDEQLSRHLASLDILVVPSLKDGRPLIIREAQALGKAIVASRVGSIPELLLHGEAGILCEPGHALEFASAVRHLMKNPAARQQMADAGHRHVHREGDIRRIMPLLKNILFNFP